MAEMVRAEAEEAGAGHDDVENVGTTTEPKGVPDVRRLTPKAAGKTEVEANRCFQRRRT
jgi:hypothetical protein